MPRVPTSPAARRARSRLANSHRDCGADHPATLDADREYRAERLAAHISEVVDRAPALKPEQRDRLAALLAPATDLAAARTDGAA